MYGPKEHPSINQAERDYIQRHLAFVETIIKAEVADVTLAHLLLSKARALRRDLHKLSDQQLYFALGGYMIGQWLMYARTAEGVAATLATASTTLRSASAVRRYNVCPNLSVSDRGVLSSQSRVRRPRASGLHGMTPIPSAAQSGSISRSSSR